ncbi:MAG: LON peptidase substrate-binding domain-containing protein [Burkholderiales bacterium]|nr:LON peptidase substrate-binding domain-containing protein [Burkholderiales bacterium]
MSQAATARPLPQPLSLFPLNLVLFPEAVLVLRIFEPRYLDLVSECLKSGSTFGVVCLKRGNESTRSASRVAFESVGVAARIDDVDAEQAGILRVRCTGLSRFRLQGPAWQRDDGLWQSAAEVIADDPKRSPGPAMLQTVKALGEAIRKLQQLEKAPFAEPYRLDDAGWVANRWCELLPVPLAAKQKLMELADPVIRLSIVDGYLRDKKVVLG